MVGVIGVQLGGTPKPSLGFVELVLSKRDFAHLEVFFGVEESVESMTYRDLQARRALIQKRLADD